MIFGVTIVCFLLSYLIVLVIEISRAVLKIPGRMLVLTLMLCLGWIAHSLFLADRLWASMKDATSPMLLSTWYQWLILAAWGLATIYLWFVFKRPENAIGTFVLPLILGLIGLAWFYQDSPPFQRDASINFWRIFHGSSWLIGTIIITFGLAVGLMYLVHAYRLKQKWKPSRGFRLPSLEYLQTLNRMCVFLSTVAMGVGSVSGAILNFNRHGQIAWSDGGILVTFALFAWLVVASIIETTSARSLGGMRTAYLSIANFLFFIVVLGIVQLSDHGRTTEGAHPTSQRPIEVARPFWSQRGMQTISLSDGHLPTLVVKHAENGNLPRHERIQARRASEYVNPGTRSLARRAWIGTNPFVVRLSRTPTKVVRRLSPGVIL